MCGYRRLFFTSGKLERGKHSCFPKAGKHCPKMVLNIYTITLNTIFGQCFPAFRFQAFRKQESTAKNGAYNIRQLLSGLSARTSGIDNGGGLKV